MTLTLKERLVLLVGDAAADVAKTYRFMAEYGKPVVVALADTDGDDTVDNVINVEGFVTSEVVLKARLVLEIVPSAIVPAAVTLTLDERLGCLSGTLPRMLQRLTRSWSNMGRP